MAEEKQQPPRTPATANALYDELGHVVNELNEIRGVCERAYELSRSAPPRDLWLSGEFPFALGTVMARTWQALERLEQVYGLVPTIDDEQRIKRGLALVEEFRRGLHQEFGARDLKTALQFCRDLATEELEVAAVGTTAEVALRNIARRAREVVGE